MSKIHAHHIVRIHEIPDGGHDFLFNSQSGELNLQLEDLLGVSPSYKIHLHVSQQDEMARVEGELSGDLPHICSRCAETFTTPFNKRFVTAYYTQEGQLDSLGSKVDDLDGSFDLEFLDGAEIDLAEVVHEQIALEIPFQPLCSESCKGLCSQCGANFNVEKCSCNPKENLQSSSPFAKLKTLFH